MKGSKRVREDLKYQHANRLLAISTGGFMVFLSVMFLLERLGAEPLILLWVSCAAIAVICLTMAFSRRTAAARLFFGDRHESTTLLASAGVIDRMPAMLLMLIVFAPAGGWQYQLMIIGLVLLGAILSGLLFTRPLRKSGASTIAEFLGFRFNSPAIRLLSVTITSLICLLLLYAEIRLVSIYLSPIINIEFTQIVVVLLFLAAASAISGGVSSLVLVLAALSMLMALCIVAVTIWLSLDLAALPIPQLLLLQEPTALVGGDAMLAQELAAGMADIWNLPMAVALVFGFAGLPHLLARGQEATSVKTAAAAHWRSVFLLLLLISATPVLRLAPQFAGDNFNNVASLMPAVLRLMVPLILLLAALAMTANLLLTIANTIAHDAYRVVQSAKVPQAREMFIARILIIFLAIGLWFALNELSFNGLRLAIWALVLCGATLMPVLVFSILWSATSRLAVLVVLIVNLALVTAGFFLSETIAGQALPLPFGMVNSPGLVFAVSLSGAVVVVCMVSLVAGSTKTGRQIISKLHEDGRETLIARKRW